MAAPGACSSRIPPGRWRGVRRLRTRRDFQRKFDFFFFIFLPTDLHLRKSQEIPGNLHRMSMSMSMSMSLKSQGILESRFPRTPICRSGAEPPRVQQGGLRAAGCVCARARAGFLERKRTTVMSPSAVAKIFIPTKVGLRGGAKAGPRTVRACLTKHSAGLRTRDFGNSNLVSWLCLVVS